MIERRSSPRIRLWVLGRIIPSSGLPPSFCTVRDISDEGAKLSCADPSQVPESFRLEIPSRALQRQATVRWRNDNEVGVQFG